MDGYKEFQGKDLDSAIHDACEFFNTDRDHLEIEIVHDAKTGIFGIVGARKALIRAHRMPLKETVSSILAQTTRVASPFAPKSERTRKGLGKNVRLPKKKGMRAKNASEEENLGTDVTESRLPWDTGNVADGRGADKAPSKGASLQKPAKASQQPARNRLPKGAGAFPKAKKTQVEESRGEAGGSDAFSETVFLEEPSAGDRMYGNPLQAQQSSVSGTGKGGGSVRDPSSGIPNFRDPDGYVDEMPSAQETQEFIDESAEYPSIALETLESHQFRSLVDETIRTLIRPIVGSAVTLSTQTDHGHLCVHIASPEDMGLLIGREGQTLQAIQYIAEQILIHKAKASLHLQLDAGAYRQRQEDKLQEFILLLVEKARATGRSFSTRPLSSYHRRLVHLLVQDMPDIQTRCLGDGPLRRIVVMRKRSGHNQAPKDEDV